MATTSTSTTSGSIPSYISAPTKEGLTGVSNFLKSEDNYVYGSKPGESLFTPTTQSQNEAMGNVSWLADQDLAEMLGTNQAGGMLMDFANYTPDQLSAERLVDEGGYLGGIDQYMNPYLEQVLAPQIRKMNEQMQIGRRDLADSATMSGAFGDSRHGLLEGDIYDSTQRNIADVTGSTMSDAWREAMGLRSGDLQTKINVDASNRDSGMAANANKANAAAGISGLGQTHLKNFMDVNDALFNSGQVQRDANEEQRVALQNYQTAIKDKRYDDALKLLGAVNGSPYQSSSTTTSNQSSNDGMWGLLGSALGGLFG